MKNISFVTRLVVLFVFVLLGACKKDKISAKDAGPSATTDRNELTKDSIFLYAKQVYLWNEALPSYAEFDPRQYVGSNNLANLNRELFALTRYGKNPLTMLPYEYNKEYTDETKYSFIDDLVANGKLAFAENTKSSIDFNGQGDDFGFSIVLLGNNSRYNIFLRFTSPGSPAFLAGLGRGAKIVKVNGKSLGTNYAGGENAFLDDALKQNAITIAGTKLNGSSFNVTLTKTKYNSSPIFKDTVLTSGTKKIGYLAYAKFTDDENSNLPLSNAFSKFASSGVTDLVIDLRYNPGGYVNTAEHLINLIAPSKLNGKTMFEQTYNATMQAGEAVILKNQPLRDQKGDLVYRNGRLLTYADENYSKSANRTLFRKEGALNNVSNVVFITTDGTASSSELVINSLKPHLTVKTVGSTSYGKPVGFFPIRIDKYDVYLSSFSTTNSLGEGNYFAGINPDAERKDDVTRDFGDPNEDSLAAAVNYLVNGRFTNSSVSSKTVNSATETKDNILKIYEPAALKGMIGAPKMIR